MIWKILTQYIKKKNKIVPKYSFFVITHSWLRKSRDQGQFCQSPYLLRPQSLVEWYERGSVLNMKWANGIFFSLQYSKRFILELYHVFLKKIFNILIVWGLKKNLYVYWSFGYCLLWLVKVGLRNDSAHPFLWGHSCVEWSNLQILKMLLM